MRPRCWWELKVVVRTPGGKQRRRRRRRVRRRQQQPSSHPLRSACHQQWEPSFAARPFPGARGCFGRRRRTPPYPRRGGPLRRAPCSLAPCSRHGAQASRGHASFLEKGWKLQISTAPLNRGGLEEKCFAKNNKASVSTIGCVGGSLTKQPSTQS